MKPEEQVELILWDWLKTKGEYIKEIYFNRKNQLNAPVFTTSGINKKPDCIIKIDRGFGFEYIIAEIKVSSSSRNIHDSGKILMYYENYVSGNTKYFIDSKQIEINHFAVMSDQSLKGKLFGEDEELISNEKSSDEWRRTNSKYSLIPKYEYQRTSDYLRRLWAEWRILKIKLKLTELPSLGIIISNPSQDNFPYLFTMVYCSWGSKKRWGQRFWRM